MNPKINLTAEQWQKLILATKLATGYTPEEIKKLSGASGKIEPPGKTDAALEAEKIIEIQRQNSKGFQVFDITPANVERMENFCVYDSDTILSIVGTQNTPLGSNSGVIYYDNPDVVFNPGGSEIMPQPYWRSVFIPITGTFLKVEYLHSQNDLYAGVTLPTRLEQRIENLSDPQNTNENTLYADEYFAANAFSSNKTILLDFTSTSQNPIQAKHGDVFKSYFDGVYITFKQNSPKIRITIGFNSEITSHDDRNKSLHMWDGEGLTNNSRINPVPFCITDRDVVSGNPFGLNISLSAGVQTVDCLIANPGEIRTIFGTNYLPNGSAYLWINDFKTSIYSTNEMTYGYDVEIVYGLLGTTASGYVTGYSADRVLAKTFIQRSSVSGFAFYDGTNQNFSEPVRVSIRQGYGVFIRFTCVYVQISVPGIPVFGKYSLNGYSMGGLYGSQASFNPFFVKRTYQDSIYPHDFDTVGSPGRV